MARSFDQRLQDAIFQWRQIQNLINDLDIRLVFTAHPTEAARRSILNKLGEVAKLLDQDLNPRQHERLAETVDLLWQTDELRLDRPEPLDEAMNALYYLDDLAKQTVPEVLNDFARELKRLNIDLPVTARPLTFGTWIGGDRDGNPNITPQVTEDAVVLQVGHAIRTTIAAMDRLRQMPDVRQSKVEAARIAIAVGVLETPDRLRAALLELGPMDGSAARARVTELENVHGKRRGWVWSNMDRSPLADALEHLAALADKTAKPLNGASLEAVATHYEEGGYEADLTLLRALAEEIGRAHV
jgi:hypothetical protein